MEKCICGMTRCPAARCVRMRDLYLAGDSMRVVGKKVGLRLTQVHDILHACGVETRPFARTPMAIDEERALRLWEDGLSAVEISRAMGVYEKRIVAFLDEKGVYTPRWTSVRPGVVEEIRRLRASGCSLKQVATATGVSVGTVLNKLGPTGWKGAKLRTR